jgi:hypothetical protein
MTDKRGLVSLSGSPILKHEARKKPFEFASGDEDTVERVGEHIEKHVGPVNVVWHEILSDLVHIDLYHVAPCKTRDTHVLVTSGMSATSMNPPTSAADCTHAELLITLPSSWPMTKEAFSDERNWWPIRMVKGLARFPHEYETWLWWSHTVENGNPPVPFHESTQLMAAILAPPLLLPKEFSWLETSSRSGIAFFSVVPIYREELKYKMNKGAQALFELFDKYHIDEIIDPVRKNTCRRWWSSFVGA